MGRTILVFGFPSSATAEKVKNFLELHTGNETVYPPKVRKSKKGGPRVYAIVRFTTDGSAEHILSLASSTRLWYGDSYLKAREMPQDIVPQQRILKHRIENLKLHFGCQISDSSFSTLWGGIDVSLSFGIGMRKFHFLFGYGRDVYRLELPYEDIWQIELHHSPSKAVKYLLIQMFGAPRVFKKLVPSRLFSEALDYCMRGKYDQWVRTTDFTPDRAIGQSSSICLELPSSLQLPDFGENFATYKEYKTHLTLDIGSSYSRNQDLVPIIGPSLDVDLPYDILFKVNLLVQNGCLPGQNLDSKFYQLVNPHLIDGAMIKFALEKLYQEKNCCYTPSSWLIEEYRKILASNKKRLRSPLIALSDGLVYVHRVQVTPLRVWFFGPEVNVSNRVLRHYLSDIDSFLRVSFVDEDLDKLHSNVVSERSSSERTEVFGRILSVLRNGIAIGNKKFEFLAFSSSQLRDNSAWMFASRRGLTAEDIRRWMGDFTGIRNVAKYAARLGQSFGSSTETLSVSRDERECIPDIELTRNGSRYVFSDGIGKISSEFAKKVAKKCRIVGFPPSAFQIRYGGYKGVVAVDPTSYFKLSLRPSMHKYDSDNTKLDVLAWSKYQPLFMNRQVITLLSTLGVEDSVFERKQLEAVEQLNAILTNRLRAKEALDLFSPGETTDVLKAMLDCGYEPHKEPFLSMMLQNLRAAKLLDLRTKSRIFVSQGRSLMGCLDETGTLEYGQVFIQICSYPVGSKRRPRKVILGTAVVAKNPCLHPGDVRVLRAVNVPALHHMVDCVVFPQKGWRPHPNECSGSDLDGDIYFVCWDPELIPKETCEPMDYTPPPAVTLDHDVEIEEVEKYFADYMVNDRLGIIANAHTVFADREPLKARSRPCIELAKKFSIAVDFPKTGVAAEIPRELYVKEYPDFMEKPDKPTYVSEKVIGKLFRQVKDIAPLESSISGFTRELARQFYDRDMEYEGFESFVDDAWYYKSNYDYKLGNLMDYYGIGTEAELLSGNIIKMSKSFTKRRDEESIRQAVKSLRKEARSWFDEKTNEDDWDIDGELAKASAWYHVTYHPRYWGTYNEGLRRPHFLSFPWCVCDKLVQIKRKSSSRGQISALADELGLGLRFI